MSKSPSAAVKKKLLLVDDEDALCATLSKLLAKRGFEVTVAPNGAVAQDLLGLEEFDAVISEVFMPGRISGTELFHYVKRSRNIPVILMTGFATLAEAKEARELGVDGFLAKPFQVADLEALLDKAVGTHEPPAAPAVSEDESYSKIRIDDFISGRQNQFDIYVRLSESKFVKIAHEGEELSLDRVRAYKQKEMQYLYMLKEDFRKYMRFNLGVAQAARRSSQVSPEKKAALMKHTSDVLLEQIYTHEIDEEMFSDAKMTVETSVSYLADSQESFDLITALNSHSDFLYSHSLGVSLYASMMARNVGWHSPQTLYKVSIGGLLHDIGKKEIPRDLLAKSRNSMSIDEIHFLETHTTRGMEILSRVSTVPSDVLQIVAQHHERDMGTGYPFGLTKGKIFPMARLLAVADEFCNGVLQNPDSPGLSPAHAINRLTSVYGNTLEPAYLHALMKVFKLPVSHEMRSKEGWRVK